MPVNAEFLTVQAHGLRGGDAVRFLSRGASTAPDAQTAFRLPLAEQRRKNVLAQVGEAWFVATKRCLMRQHRFNDFSFKPRISARLELGNNFLNRLITPSPSHWQQPGSGQIGSVRFEHVPRSLGDDLTKEFTAG